jgi:ATP-binding cassette subfamily F protein uup
LETLEAEMAQMEKKKAQLLENINKGGSHVEVTKWAIEIEGLTNSQAEKEMRWLELSENA